MELDIHTLSRRLSTRLAAITALIMVAILAVVWYKSRAARLEIEEVFPRIGTIDYYGLHTVTASQLRAKLNLKDGDIASMDTKGAALRLEQVPGVARAYVTIVRNSGNEKASLFIGIEEKNTPHFDYHPVPAGTVMLPKQMTEAYAQLIQAMPNALANGADEDDSQGYALIQDATMLPLEQKMIAFAASDMGTLRDVLKNSADANQRIAAAWIIGYTPDKRAIIADLLNAIRDPDSTVRNNATRSIAVIAEFASDRPEMGIRIDPSPFIEMLNSLIWTDRNKATAVLLALTEKPSPETLQMLRERALPALTEMARWKDSHYEDALQLLGRIAGLDEKEIQAAVDHGERERVIALAAATANTNSGASDLLPVH